MALTAKQQRFVDEYLIDLNATQSAIRAGYSEKTAYSIGQENLKKPEIQKALTEAMQGKEEATIAKQDEILRYLTSVMRGEIEEEQIVVTSEFGMSKADIMSKQVSAKDRTKAAELLAKRYGMLTENMNVNGAMPVRIVDDLE